MTEIFPSIKRQALENKHKSKIEINNDLNRQLVSYQANKTIKFFRWFKYKEAFSQPMVSYILNRLTKKPGYMLDPFAGIGSALFTARDKGWRTTGIELLPVGIFAIKTRLAAENVTLEDFRKAIDSVKNKVWMKYISSLPVFHHVRISHGAYPENTEKKIHAYLTYCNQEIDDENLRTLLKFAAFSILEPISYTRKDGQYLRWTNTPNRPYATKKKITKHILEFEPSIINQLEMMWEDINVVQGDLFSQSGLVKPRQQKQEATVYEDSCLTRLSKIKARRYDFIITSPPYCNRYDYTRTYALELVFLGADEEKIRQLRQEMLSCTVENLEKVNELQTYYKKQRRSKLFKEAVKAFESQEALQEVLQILDTLREQDKLNNPGIARMVRNYFLEMSFVIHECARLMKPGAYFVMVNDNVSYHGQSVPVDLILSEFAIASGLDVEKIWKLGKGKGQSSQQMGRYGRQEQRKCVYIWKRPKVK